MKKYFIMSDIHSFYDEMQKALKKQSFDISNPNHILIICGDLFDRGSKSKEVLQFVQSLGDRFIYIRGNHEDLLMDCLQEIASGRTVSPHHYSNGTVRTIAQFCDLPESSLLWVRREDSINYLIYEKMKPIINWINEKSIDYIEIDNNIFVHGWIPITGTKIGWSGEWMNPEMIPQDQWDEDTNKWAWKEARWVNGAKLWKQGIRIPNKTIIAGHYHSSWAHSHLHQDRKEFPDKSKKDWKKSFEPFTDDGIIIIDSCCAYSGFLNCIVLEVE